MIRVNVNALVDDFEQAAGSCEIAAKQAAERGDHEAAMFYAGAYTALDHFTRCKSPENFATLIGVFAETRREEYGA